MRWLNDFGQINPLTTNVPYHIETCLASIWWRTLVVKGLHVIFYKYTFNNISSLYIESATGSEKSNRLFQEKNDFVRCNKQTCSLRDLVPLA